MSSSHQAPRTASEPATGSPSDHAPTPSPAAGDPDFRAALAQWRLQLRTEVKKVSSLPTAMFDTIDPMLEMRLAECTETMLHQLQVPGNHLLSTNNEDLRLEEVDQEAIRALPKRFAKHDATPVDLLSNLNAEYFGVLADMCRTQDGAIRERAVGLICSDFGITNDGLEEATEELWRMTVAANIDAGNDRDSEPELRAEFDQVTKVMQSSLQPKVDQDESSNATPRQP
ncbi:MAG: hypothetical protein NXI31_00190 [bacterium]|nr:hypothetical protein [bacterium]